jgi:hypothetical protein
MKRTRVLLRIVPLLMGLITVAGSAGAQRVHTAAPSWTAAGSPDPWLRVRAAVLLPGVAAAEFQTAPRVHLRPSAAERKRLLPYVIGGTAAGGVLGYIAQRRGWLGGPDPEDCDMFECVEAPIGYVWAGLAIGGSIGWGIGKLRRPRTASAPPAG